MTVRNIHARLFDQWSAEGGLVDIRTVVCDQRAIEQSGKKREQSG
jgi:hypothetical protein